MLPARHPRLTYPRNRRVGITVDGTGSMERIQYGTQARQHHFGAKKNQSGTRATSFRTRTSTWNTGGVLSTRSRMTFSRVPKRRALVLGVGCIRFASDCGMNAFREIWGGRWSTSTVYKQATLVLKEAAHQHLTLQVIRPVRVLGAPWRTPSPPFKMHLFPQAKQGLSSRALPESFSPALAAGSPCGDLMDLLLARPHARPVPHT